MNAAEEVVILKVCSDYTFRVIHVNMIIGLFLQSLTATMCSKLQLVWLFSLDETHMFVPVKHEVSSFVFSLNPP